MKSVKINNEIGKLKKVLLHRPGKELLNLVPDYLEDMLFDDIPYLEVAQNEHDFFADTLRACKVEVVYLTDLTAESIEQVDVKHQFVNQYIDESGSFSDTICHAFNEFLFSFDNLTLVERTIEGTRKNDLISFVKNCPKTKGEIEQIRQSDYPFVAPPMPNSYFSRDPFVFIGNGVMINKMHTIQRSRETLLGHYIFHHHNEYKHLPKFYTRDLPFSIEGGDVLILSDKVVAVGISERTQIGSVQTLAQNLFDQSNFEKVLAINIPKKRSFMHLDTVFTMINKNTFTIHPNTEQLFSVTKFCKNTKQNNALVEGSIEQILQSELELDKVNLIRCGGNNAIDAAREQWSDGANTLAISPSEVVVYSRNTVTNKLLEQQGIKTHKILCSELSRGRGGPRCMSMPILRDDV